ncbi:MAG: winged helix DNA-binding domain-containing protein [Actinomycetota bacterium]|nr:winged helix DNA-binding domain-containing protein [Actinomycetota bacterium]
MATTTLTTRQRNRATLARQLLLEPAELSVPEAVERLGGLQAQEPKPPFIGLWTRLAEFEEADLEQALHDRSVVRATMMRGTLHLATADDYAGFRAPLQTMLARGMMSALRDRAEGLDPDAVLPVARELLEARPRTFDELRTLLQEAFPEVNHRALGYAVRMLLPLVMVPTADRWAFPRVAEFTLAERWLGRPLSGDEGPEELVLRYLAAFGPASAADVQTWSGLQGIKAVLDGLRPRLASFADEGGRELFDLPDAPRPPDSVAAPPRLLPEFDSLLLAHADRARVIADEHRPAVITKNLRVRATFLIDGFVRGTWEIKRSRRTAKLTITPFAPLSKRDAAALRTQATALLRFTDGDASAPEVILATPP